MQIFSDNNLDAAAGWGNFIFQQQEKKLHRNWDFSSLNDLPPLRDVLMF